MRKMPHHLKVESSRVPNGKHYGQRKYLYFQSATPMNGGKGERIFRGIDRVVSTSMTEKIDFKRLILQDVVVGSI